MHIWENIAPENHSTQAETWALTDPHKLMGAGPFYLEEYDNISQIIHLKANPYFVDWFGADPNFDDVYFEFYPNKEGALIALASGAIDMVDAQFSPQLDEIDIPGVTYELVDNPGIQEMAINQYHPYLGTGELCPISDPASGAHIRKAISHIVPRQVFADEICGGIGRPGITAWSPVSVGFDDTLEPYEYNITLALDHMRAAGFDVPYETPTTSITPTTPFTPTTIISGIAFSSIIGSLILAGCITIIVRYKKRRLS